MGLVFSNNGETTLAAGLTAIATSCVVTSTLYFPTANGTDYFYATIIKQDGTNEIVKVTNEAGTTYTIERGQDDTSGTAFSIGDKFQLRIPKIILETFRDDIATNATDLAGTTNAGSVPAPAGTSLFFHQAAAPSQWTIDATVADQLLAVKGGTEDYNVAGGSKDVGSWTPTNHIHTMPSHTHDIAHTHGMPTHTHTMGTHIHTMGTHKHTMGTHTHTGSVSGTTSFEDKPNGEQGSGSNDLAKENHTHTFSDSFTTSATDPGDTSLVDPGNTNSTDPGDTNATDPGDTNSQSTSTSGSTDPGDTNGSAAPSTDRPLAAVGILATKD